MSSAPSVESETHSVDTMTSPRSSVDERDEAVSNMSAEMEEEEAMTSEEDDNEYFRPIKKLRMVPVVQGPAAPVVSKPLTSFFIKDILSPKPVASRTLVPPGAAIVRPWDLDGSGGGSRRPRSADDDSRSESDSPESPATVANGLSSPLDALFEMTSKAFEGLDANEKSADPSRDHMNMFTNRQQPKKKRKSRTAFTNHQIFELEKRFLYQKYLSPADRDEIAQSLGLTNAQVITWFQNRRAKLKRDMEELKKDVDNSKLPTLHTAILDNLQDLSLLKKEFIKKAN